MTPTCELCGYHIRPSVEPYSLPWCNQTGRGVTLHPKCCARLEAIGRDEADLVLLAMSGKLYRMADAHGTYRTTHDPLEAKRAQAKGFRIEERVLIRGKYQWQTLIQGTL